MKNISLKAKRLREEALKSDSKKARKLLALADIEDGENVRSVARKNNVSQQTVYNWLKAFHEKGYHAFEKNQGRPHSRKFASKRKARELEIISQNYSGKDAKKILVVAQMLMKKKRVDIAIEANVSFALLYKWTAAFNKGGLAELLRADNRRRRPNRLNLRKDIARCDVLRAAACVSERSALRLQAIALLLDGKRLEEVAGDLGMSKSSISKWGIRFNKGGVDSLVSKFDRNTSGDIEYTPHNQG